MPIFNTEQLTPAQFAAREILGLSGAMFQAIVGNYKSQFDKFWRNPSATPAEVAEACGVNCVKLFVATEALRQAILAIDSEVLPAEYQYNPEVQGGYTVEMENGVPTGRISIP